MTNKITEFVGTINISDDVSNVKRRHIMYA